MSKMRAEMSGRHGPDGASLGVSALSGHRPASPTRILDSAPVRFYACADLTQGMDWLFGPVPKGDAGCFDGAKRARQAE